MRKSQIALGERWKLHFQTSRFQNFSGEVCPLTPIAARAPALAYTPAHFILLTALF